MGREMKIEFYGGAKYVTGSCHILKVIINKKLKKYIQEIWAILTSLL
jgi:hypothetical protein